jgi:hypothetical protein
VIARRLVLALALTALVPFLAACGGGDSSNASEQLPTTAPTLTVPGETKTPSVDNSASDESGANVDETTTSTATTTTPTQTTAAPSNPSTPQGGAAAPQTGGATPDSPQNDTSPPADSPASKFEQFCKENPGAC